MVVGRSCRNSCRNSHKRTPVAMASQISYRLTSDRHTLGSRHYSFGQAKSCRPLPRHKSPSTNALPATLQKRCDDWLALDQEPRSRNEAQQAINAEDLDYLQECMGGRLAFGGCSTSASNCCYQFGLLVLVQLPARCCCSVGTAGLRGLMGIGFNRMNEVVVQQTTQGFCRYMQAHAKDKLESRGVAIGKHAPPPHQALAFQQLLAVATSLRAML